MDQTAQCKGRIKPGAAKKSNYRLECGSVGGLLSRIHETTGSISNAMKVEEDMKEQGAGKDEGEEGWGEEEKKKREGGTREGVIVRIERKRRREGRVGERESCHTGSCPVPTVPDK